MMNRRQFLTGCGASAAALAASRCSGSGARRPNIVFLLTDDHRWDALGAMRHPILETPHIDRLAAQGALFENAFVTTAICATSRASIFSGLYEPCHRVSDFATPLAPEVYRTTYPIALREAGYRTGFIGKYGVGREMPEGDYDYWKGFPGQGHYFPEEHGGKVHLTSLMGDQALEFLDGCTPEQPFCLSVSFKAPHVQDQDPRQFLYDPAHEHLYQDVEIPVPELAAERFYRELPPYLRNSEGRRRWKIRFETPEKYQRSVKGYLRLIYGVDVQVGRIVGKLREKGFDDNTVILFLGDNGFYLGERGLAGKWYMHEESIRVPLIVRDPRAPLSAKARRHSQMALNIDIAPTILRLAGLEPPPSMQGRDLMPIVAGESPEWRREWYYSHLFEHPAIPKSEGVRRDGLAWFRFPGYTPAYEALYDLDTDPAEQNNLAAEPRFASQLDEMRERCRIWRESLAAWRHGETWVEPA